MEPAKKPDIDTTRFCMVGGASLFNLTDGMLTTKTTSRKHPVEMCSPTDKEAVVKKTVNVIHDVWIGTIDELTAKFRSKLTEAAAYATQRDVDAGVVPPPIEWAITEQTQKVLAEAGV